MKKALEESIPIMEKACQKENDLEGFKIWQKKIWKVIQLFDEAETLNDKVIAIDCADQFLRACY